MSTAPVTHRIGHLDGKISLISSVLLFAKCMKLQASLPSPWDRVASCKLPPSRFAVEPPRRTYLRLTLVAFQSRQTPSITKP